MSNGMVGSFHEPFMEPLILLLRVAQLQARHVLIMAQHLLHMQPSAPVVCVNSVGEWDGK